MLDKWRARIGWIHPRVNSDIEIYDFYQAAPKDVVLVITHLEVVDSARKEEVEASLQYLERAVERLSLAKVDFIMKNGAPVHLHYGNEGHRKILERLRAASKVPVTTSSQALADAFRTLGAKTILVISSWRKESVHLSENLRNFLNSAGIDIAALEGIGGRQLTSYEKLALTPEQIYHNALEVCQKHPAVDAIYIQSGTMATMGIIDELEQRIGKPVVSSNSANIWGSFKPLNIKVGSGFGRLLASI
ncbi:MAG TPA: aspartate/glutamate racemase family protein [Candidatus Binatia bacterium]|jgi:maleate isomerase